MNNERLCRALAGRCKSPWVPFAFPNTLAAMWLAVFAGCGEQEQLPDVVPIQRMSQDELDYRLQQDTGGFLFQPYAFDFDDREMPPYENFADRLAAIPGLGDPGVAGSSPVPPDDFSDRPYGRDRCRRGRCRGVVHGRWLSRGGDRGVFFGTLRDERHARAGRIAGVFGRGRLCGVVLRDDFSPRYLIRGRYSGNSFQAELLDEDGRIVGHLNGSGGRWGFCGRFRARCGDQSRPPRPPRPLPFPSDAGIYPQDAGLADSYSSDGWIHFRDAAATDAYPPRYAFDASGPPPYYGADLGYGYGPDLGVWPPSADASARRCIERTEIGCAPMERWLAHAESLCNGFGRLTHIASIGVCPVDTTWSSAVRYECCIDDPPGCPSAQSYCRAACSGHASPSLPYYCPRVDCRCADAGAW